MKHNPNYLRSLYFLNIIVLCLVTLLSLVTAVRLIRRNQLLNRTVGGLNNQLETLKGNTRALFTAEQASQQAETAKKTGAAEERRNILNQIQSSLETGHTATETLRSLYDKQLIIEENGQYIFAPLLVSLRRHSFSKNDFSLDENGFLIYTGSDESVRMERGLHVSQANGWVDWERAASTLP